MRKEDSKKSEQLQSTSWFSWLTWENTPRIATYFLCSLGAYFVFKEMSGLFSKVAPADDIRLDLGASTSLDIIRKPFSPASSAQTSRHLLSNPVPPPNIEQTEGRDPVTITLDAADIFGPSVGPSLTVQSAGGGPLPPFVTSVSSSFNPIASLPNPASDPDSSGNFVMIRDANNVYAIDVSNPLSPFISGGPYSNPITVSDISASTTGTDVGLSEDNSPAGQGFVRIGPLTGSLSFIERINVPSSIGPLTGLILDGNIVWLIANDFYRYDVSAATCSGISTCSAMTLGYSGIVLNADIESFSRNVWIIAGSKVTRITDTAGFGGDYTPPGGSPIVIKVTATSSTNKPLHVVTANEYFELVDNIGGGGISLVGNVLLPPSAGTATDLAMTTDNNAVVTCTNAMVIIDRSNPAAPVVVAEIPMTTPQGIAGVGSSVLLARGSSGVDVYDFSNGFKTNVTVAAGVGDQGNYALQVVSDTAEIALFNVTVIPELPPTLEKAMLPQIVEVGTPQVITFNNPFGDKNGDKVTMEITDLPPWIFANSQQQGADTQQFLTAPTKPESALVTVKGTDDSSGTLSTTTTAQVSAGYIPKENLKPSASFDLNGGLQTHEFPPEVLLVNGQVDPSMIYEILNADKSSLSPWFSADGRKLTFDPTKLPPETNTVEANFIIRGTTSLPLTGETQPFLVPATAKETAVESLESVRSAVDKLTAEVEVKFERTINIVPGAVRTAPTDAKVTLTLDGDAPGWVGLKVVDTGSEQNAVLSGTPPRSATDVFGPFRQGKHAFHIQVKVASNNAKESVRVEIGVSGTSWYMITLYVVLLLRFGPLIARRLGSLLYNRWKQRTPPENIGRLTRFTLEQPATGVEAFDYEETEGKWRRFLFTGRRKRAAGLPYGVTVIPSSDGKGIIGVERSGIAELQRLQSRILALRQKPNLTAAEEERLQRLELEQADKISELDFSLNQSGSSRFTSYVFTQKRGFWPFRCDLIAREVLEPGNASSEQQRLLPGPTAEAQNNPIFNRRNGIESEDLLAGDNPACGMEDTAIEMESINEGLQEAGIYSPAAAHGLFSQPPGAANTVGSPLASNATSLVNI